MARNDIVAGVLEAGRIRAQAEAYGAPALHTVACPYKGLARFERGDADFFHGRDRLVAELVARLVDAPMVAVVGASGSGKSSVLRAGLLAALQAGALPGSDGWRQVILTPTTPDAAISESVQARTILVIDQFEEAFTVLGDTERAALIDRIVKSIEAGDTTVVLAARSDHYARCAEDSMLGGLVAANTVLVSRMAADELRQAIERPATLAGLRIEDGLVDLLVDQAREAPGGLPLLSVALVSLWQRRSGRTLTVGAYRASDGVAGSVERLGEQALAELRDANHRDAARRMLVRLATSAGGETIAARRADLGELMAVGGPAAGEVLDVLVGRRLVSVSDESVEVAHEALFTHWSRLRGWLAEDVSGRALRAHLGPAAPAWADRDRDAGELYRGARLAAVLDWAAIRANELIPVEREFLDASRAAAVADQMRQRRNLRRLRAALAAALTALLVAVAGTVFAVNQQRRAEAASRAANAERLGSQALIEPQMTRALLLAAAADRLQDNWQTRANLLATLLRSPNLIHTATLGDAEAINAQAISVDGRLIAIAGRSGTIRVFDATTLRPADVFAVPEHGSVDGMSFTLDGKRLVTWGGDLIAKTSSDKRPPDVVTWDLASGKQIGGDFGDDGSNAGAILADGRTVVVLQFPPQGSPNPPLAVAWDLRTHQKSDMVQLPGFAANSVNVSTDRRKVLIDGPDGISVVDTVTRSTRLLRGVHGFPALSPDGRALAVTDPNGGRDIAVWDLATARLRGFARHHTAAVSNIAWSPDGSTFTSASDDGTAVVWDAATLTPRIVLNGHTAAVGSASYGPDGRTVYTSGADGTLLEWDVSDSRTLDQVVHASSQPLGVIDPVGFDRVTGQFLYDVVEANDVVVHRVDATTGAEVGVPITFRPDTNVIQVSPNGRYVSVSYADGEAQVFDPSAGRPLTPPVKSSGLLARFAETGPTGRMLAVADRGGSVPCRCEDDDTARIELFDLPTGQKIGSLPLSANNGGLRFSPDGRYLASGMANGEVAIFDVPARRLVKELRVYAGSDTPNVLEFSPDGRLLVVSGLSGGLGAWHVGSWTRAWTANVISNNPTGFINFSPNSRLIAVTGGEGTVLLFDTATGDAIGTSLMNNAADAVFDPNGKSLIVLDSGEGVHRLDVDPRSWLQRACSIAGRDFTSQEWQRYVPGQPRITVCPGEA